MLLVEDDGGSPVAAREKAEKLSNVDQVAAFVGNLGSAPNSGSADYINQQEIPDLFIATGATAFTDADALPWTVIFNRTTRQKAPFSLATSTTTTPTAQSPYCWRDEFGGEGRDAFVGNFEGDVVAEEKLRTHRHGYYFSSQT